MAIEDAMKRDTRMQMVTFELGEESYGIDIMDVLEIHPYSEIRSIPHAPDYVSGIFNLRGEIIPIISLHTRFRVEPKQYEDEDDHMSGFVIFNIGKTKLGVTIDKILRVVTIDISDLMPAPQMITGAGTAYIEGVVNQGDDGYLVVLNIMRLFDAKELARLEGLHREQQA
ncbi:MAG: chemotaxis protein CheW [Spirochaetia bacterium]